MDIMPKLLNYLNWVFFVYRENERYHAHVFKKGNTRTSSAKVFLTKNGKKGIEWISYGAYKKNAAELDKIVEEHYDWLIKSAKISSSGKKVVPKVIVKKVKPSKK